MEQRDLQSTKLHAPLPLSTSLNVDPSQEPQNKATHNLFALLLPSLDLCKSYSYQTGRFPIQSSRGYQYVFILYEYDSNAILSKPLKCRQAMDITTTWTELHHELRANMFSPTLHILDNECSQVMKQAFAKHSVNFQLVPPHVHRRNPAEGLIQTWKNHFSAGLATCDQKFPLAKWDASDMILKICSDVAYLVLPKAKSRVAVHYHLGWQHNPGRVNGTVAILCQTLKNVFGSATGAEIRGIYTGGGHGAPMIAALEEMGHKQPSTGTPFKIDNSCAHGILNSKMRQKLSKTFDMRFWWIKDCIKQKQ
jgi:hypothetical protein